MVLGPTTVSPHTASRSIPPFFPTYPRDQHTDRQIQTTLRATSAAIGCGLVTPPEGAAVALDNDARLDRLDELGRLSADVHLVAGSRDGGNLRRRHVGGVGRCRQDAELAAGFRRAGRVPGNALEVSVVGRHAVGDVEPTTPGGRVVADGEVIAVVDVAVVVVPGHGRRRVTADDAAERHFGAVASRHVLQLSGERRRYGHHTPRHNIKQRPRGRSSHHIISYHVISYHIIYLLNRK